MTFSDLVALVAARFIAREEAYRARVAGSKTNLDYLMNVGVVITADDAMDNAYRAEHLSKQAKLAGVSVALYEAADDYARAFDAVVYDVLRTASAGETGAEHSARFHAAEAALPAKLAEGAKKPCKHNDTKKARGWFALGSGPVVEEYVCCRCGSKLSIPRKPAVPSAAAREAQAFVLANRSTFAAYVLGFENYGF
jgi:hypothetical protein